MTKAPEKIWVMHRSPARGDWVGDAFATSSDERDVTTTEYTRSDLAEKAEALNADMRQDYRAPDTDAVYSTAWNDAIEAAKNVFRQFAPEAVFDAKLIVYKLASIKKGDDQ